MRVVTAARHVSATVTFATDKDARRHLLVVCKATFSIPENGRVPRPLLPPLPVAFTDTFCGESGESAPLYESELASTKASCDVLFTASACTPDGKPHTSLDVAAQVGSMAKTLRVWGDRQWEKDLLILRAGRPKPFTTMPLHLGRAFGGAHRLQEGESVRFDAFAPNPFGRGYAADPDVQIHGLPMPNLEFPNAPVRHPRQGVPAAFSPLPRTVPERVRYAGTYDEEWKNTVAPYLPQDFDERFFQAAPEDQRIPYPSGGETVRLINMMPGRPEVHFALPRLDTMPVRVLHTDFRVSEPPVRVDTLHFEPDEGRFSVVWRALAPLSLRGARDVQLVVVGEVCSRWWAGIRAGRAGCTGCGAKINIGGAGAAATNSHPLPASPELCPEQDGSPAMNPHIPFPEMCIKVEPAEPASTEQISNPVEKRS